MNRERQNFDDFQLVRCLLFQNRKKKNKNKKPVFKSKCLSEHWRNSPECHNPDSLRRCNAFYIFYFLNSNQCGEWIFKIFICIWYASRNSFIYLTFSLSIFSNYNYGWQSLGNLTMVQSVSLLKGRNTTYPLPTHVHTDTDTHIYINTHKHCERTFQSEVRNAKRVIQNRVWRILRKKGLCTSPVSIFGVPQTFDSYPLHLGYLLEDIILLWTEIEVM